jgi:hypothetical protein
MYLLKKYIKWGVWRVAVCLSYIYRTHGYWRLIWISGVLLYFLNMNISNDKRDIYKNIGLWFLKIKSYKLISFKKNGVPIFETFILWCHPDSISHRISVKFTLIFIQKVKTYPSFDRVARVNVWKPKQLEPIRWHGSLFFHMKLLRSFVSIVTQ